MASSERRIALVTGANRGMGLETARQLARLGFLVLLGCRRAGAGRAAEKLLRDEGLDARFLRLDVTKPDQITQAAADIGRRFGKLDVLVNNAGMGAAEEERSANSTATVSPAVLRRTFDVNFFGLVELTQRLLPLLRKSASGRIVNLSSILGSLTVHSGSGGRSYMPFAYDASKTAVNAFTIHLAAALEGTGIKANSCHPGWVRTDMGGPHAPLSPAEGARTAVALAVLGPDGPSGKFFHEGKELPW